MLNFCSLRIISLFMTGNFLLWKHRRSSATFYNYLLKSLELKMSKSHFEKIELSFGLYVIMLWNKSIKILCNNLLY